jgi:hypothetical protein
MQQLLRQIMSRPIAAVTAGFELLGQRMKSGQRIDGILSRIIHTLSRAPGKSDNVANQPPAHITERQQETRVEASTEAQSEARGLEGSGASIASGDTHGVIAEAAMQGCARMDTDLYGEMLQLVRYQVLFVRREYEHAFTEKEALVEGSFDSVTFTAWKIAEFMQELRRGETVVPERWKKKNYPSGACVSNGKLVDLPPEDRKYLRLRYQVLERYPRERFRHEKQQVRVLEQIRDAIGSGDK